MIKQKREEINNIMVNKYNELYKNQVESIEDVLDILSEEFTENYDRLGDAQLAYDTLEDEHKEFMTYSDSCFFVYSLSGGSCWSVSTGSGYDENKLDEYIKEVKSHYLYEDVENLDDILCSMERQIGKDMSNAGYDMHTALKMILEEDFDFGGDNVFVIEGADEEPRIEIDYL